MWQRSGKFVLQYRLPLLVVLFAATTVMGYYASKVKLSYEFAKAIPTDNPKYLAYQAFRERFGDDGNVLVAGILSDKFFDTSVFRAYTAFHREIKKVKRNQQYKSTTHMISVYYAIFSTMHVR